MLKIKNLLLYTVIFTASIFSATAFEWTHTNAVDAKIDSAVIKNVFKSFDSDVYSCVIVRNGKIVDEYFKDGYNNESSFTLQSVSKSVTSALIGIAIDQGYIKSVDDLASDYLDELNHTKFPQMKKITIRQLLNNTSGLLGTDSSIWYKWRTSDDWVEYILSRPMTYAPGKTFEYSTGNTHLLGIILERATGKKMMDYANEFLFNRIGITTASLGSDPKGNPDAGNGFSMSSYDMARFGLLYLNKGRWEGKQIVPENWVKESTALQARRPNGSRYGFQWWLRNYGRAGYLGYNAQGHGGEYIFVVPQQDLIIVFTSWHEGNVDSYFYNVDKIVNATK